MMEMVNNRRNAEKKEERYDLFSSLLDASEDDLDGQTKLTDRELLGKAHQYSRSSTLTNGLYRKYLHFLTCRCVLCLKAYSGYLTVLQAMK